MHIHVVAVSGTGMGPLAGLLKSLGHTVTGSDVAFDPPIGPLLEQWGVVCREGFDAQHLEDRPDLVVVGNLCRRNNAEVVEAERLGLARTHIGGALQRFALEGTRPLVVTGTHGKTTTSAVAASLLDLVGKAPGYLIGGVPHGLTTSFRAARAPTDSEGSGSDSSPFVIEGDEYDTAFFEKTAKFLHYGAQVVVLTSLEHDHIDIYPTFEDYCRPFEVLLQKLPEKGLVVANAAHPKVVELVRAHARVPVIWYGAEPPEPAAGESAWKLHDVETHADGETFRLSVNGVECGRFQTPMMGRYNVGNCVAALAAVSAGYGIALADLREPLKSVRGVARRQQLLGSPGGVLVYDDFAHHPTAVRETLQALRDRHSTGILWAVFEPRSATACRALHQLDYPNSFQAADRVILAPVARDLPAEERLNVPALAEALSAAGTEAVALPDVEAIVELIRRHAVSGDVVAVLSNGKFGGIHGRLLEALSAAEAAVTEP